MQRKKSECELFMSLSDVEKDRELAKFGHSIEFAETRPLTAADRRQLARARTKRRPKATMATTSRRSASR
jgi:hypothetical protein